MTLSMFLLLKAQERTHTCEEGHLVLKGLMSRREREHEVGHGEHGRSDCDTRVSNVKV